LAIKTATRLDQVMLDIQAAVAQVKTAGKVGVVGYCWGGLLSYVAAARLPVDAAVSYYGGGTQQHLAEKPRAPMMFHFGEKDSHIPLSTVKEIEAAYPQGTYYLYPAGHGFNCNDRASFEPASAKLAFERSLDFFHTHVG
jgi:carboxymethylenebutenolidase